MPFEETKVSPNAWEDGLSNDIIIFGKRYPLTSSSGKRKIVRNFLDDSSLDILKLGQRRGSPFPLVRPRRGNPKDIKSLKDVIDYAVLHFDMTSNARKTLAVLVSRDVSSHFCIAWNGVIFQFADVALKTAHAGQGKNDQSIGIDLNHLGPRYGRVADRDRLKRFKALSKAYEALAREKLQERGLSPKQVKQQLDDYRFEKARTMRLNGGAPLIAPGYTPKQYESLILLLKLFVRELDLEKNYPMTPDGKVLPHYVEGDDAKKLKGFVGHWHLSLSRWDPGPGFDWERVLAALQHEYNSFPLMWEKHHVIGSARDLNKVRRAAHEMTRNSETARYGGTYPIGPNQTWHGGMHLYPPTSPGRKKRYPVYAMFDGTVVAAHFEDGRRSLGHNNFVLMRHEIPIPKRNGKLNDDGTPETDDLVFYSLYMHLDAMDVTRAGAMTLQKKDSVEWLKRLYELEDADPGSQRDKLVKSFEEKVKERRRLLQERIDRGEAIDDELEALIELSDDDLEEELTRNAADFLTVGQGSVALQDPGKIALLANKELECRVSAREVLGFVGLTEVEDDKLVPTLHVEIFGNEACFQTLDLDRHGEHFRTPQRSRSSDLTVKTEDILAYFRQASRRPLYRFQVWPDERIAPDEIKDFFAQSEVGNNDPIEQHREQLRRSITYHVSEWSDQVDWVTSLTGGNDWAKEAESTDFRKVVQQKGLFSNEIRKFLPFVWLNKSVAESIGLAEDGWDGRVYHFHPIHFLLWVSYYAVRRNRVFRTRMSLARLARLRRRTTAIEKLVEKGEKARSKGQKSWQKFQRSMSARLSRSPFNLSRKVRKKRPEKQSEYDSLLAEIINRIDGEYVASKKAHMHGVIENYTPMYSHPKEVLQELYDVPTPHAWRVRRREDDS